jgi:acyl-CoA thioester hydrolase
MARVMPSVSDVQQLPAQLVQRVPPEWQDRNGHVNVLHYLDLYDRASWPLLASLGVDERYFSERRRGLFDLEHHVWYLSELHVGEEVGVHLRFMARNAKRLHGAMFIVNRSRGVLASAFEYLSTGADLDTRRTAPIPDDFASALDRVIAEHRVLPWDAPTCGSIRI